MGRALPASKTRSGWFWVLQESSLNSPPIRKKLFSFLILTELLWNIDQGTFHFKDATSFLIKIILLKYMPQSTLEVFNRTIIFETPSNIFWLLMMNISLCL